jgi:hypothetical protein
LAAEVNAYRQTSDERRGHQGVPRQFLCDPGPDIVQLYCLLRKRVVTRDRAAARRQDEGNGSTLFEILSACLRR